jgi:murein DD-endopeptidase MepM/ murein hydrolase activator NlpD
VMWCRSPAFRRPIAVAAGLIVGSVAVMVPPARSDTKAELEAARANLRELQERITTRQDRLAALRAEANAIVAQMNQVESTIALLEQESNTVRRAITKARRRMWVNQRQLDNRVREMFQTGSAPELSVLVDFTSLHDLSTRLEIIDRATESDRDVIERAEALAARLQHRQEQLEELARVHSAERSDLGIQSARFEAQATVIRQLDEDRRAAVALIGELDDKRKREIQRARQLARAATQAIVGSSRPLRAQPKTGLTNEPTPQPQTEPSPEPTPQAQAEPSPGPTPQAQAEPSPGPTPQAQAEPSPEPTVQPQTEPTAAPTPQPQIEPTASSSTGTVFQICPVDQPRAYTNDFGAPRSGGRTHQGNDVFAPQGTPIRAPFPGTASEASNGLGGIAVKVYGEKGHVYNAHLSRIGTMGKVSAGTIIGYVGATGNARGTSPHNHFEWHPGDGSAVSPYSYLNEVC